MKSGLLCLIRWWLNKLRSQYNLYSSFSWTGSRVYLYKGSRSYWMSIRFVARWRIFPTELCLIVYSVIANTEQALVGCRLLASAEHLFWYLSLRMIESVAIYFRFSLVGLLSSWMTSRRLSVSENIFPDDNQ